MGIKKPTPVTKYMTGAVPMPMIGRQGMVPGAKANAKHKDIQPAKAKAPAKKAVAKRQKKV